MKKLILLLLFIPLVFSCSDDSDSDSCVTNTPDPVVCIEVYQPVCGCNNVTYSNDCYAGASGISSWTEGECSD